MTSPEDFALEIVKQLPIKEAYQDIAQPGAKQAGELVQDLVKVVQLALAPVQLLAAMQDRYRNFIDRSVRRVPVEKRISPAPQIVGPVLESIRYEPEDTRVDEMFSQLLSRACDSERVSEAHPAYPFLIKQLATDEAMMIIQCSHERVQLFGHQRYDRDRKYLFPLELREHGFKSLRSTKNVHMYIGHLRQMGLLQEETMRIEATYNAGPHGPGLQNGNDIYIEATLSEFGKHFARAVLNQP
jgi:hypothetical protein